MSAVINRQSGTGKMGTKVPATCGMMLFGGAVAHTTMHIQNKVKMMPGKGRWVVLTPNMFNSREIKNVSLRNET